LLPVERPVANETNTKEFNNEMVCTKIHRSQLRNGNQSLRAGRWR
jgi:hypothetical protein